MKRIGNLNEKVYDEANIELADNKARRNKKKRSQIKKHDKFRGLENYILSLDFRNLEYKTSEYKTFKIYEPKERIIYKLPYYPDRIAHHAIMNIMEPIWKKILIHHTYSSIKGRGIHLLKKDLEKVLKKYPDKTQYCLKLDIHKFYPSINHDILYDIICKKIKDPNLLVTLKEIIYSTDGVPIGNYLSQYFANLYLAYFDHWIKEELKCKFYFRYADDIVILSDNKEKLHNILVAIKIYLKHVLKLELKPNYQIFPVDSRGIDYVGYVFHRDYTLLRKSIKKKIFRLITKKNKSKKFKESLQSYLGWLKHCDSKHLLQLIEQETGIHFSNWESCSNSDIHNKSIYIVELITYSKYFEIHYVYNHKSFYKKSSDKELFLFLSQFKYPIQMKIL